MGRGIAILFSGLPWMALCLWAVIRFIFCMSSNSYHLGCLFSPPPIQHKTSMVGWSFECGLCYLAEKEVVSGFLLHVCLWLKYYYIQGYGRFWECLWWGGKLKEHRYVDLMSKYIPCLVFHVGVVTISLHKHFQRLLLIMLKTVNETIGKSCSS